MATENVGTAVISRTWGQLDTEFHVDLLHGFPEMGFVSWGEYQDIFKRGPF
jgi:hypothetical protein